MFIRRKLTNEQQKTVAITYLMQTTLTQTETAKTLGISQSTLSFAVKDGANLICQEAGVIPGMQDAEIEERCNAAGADLTIVKKCSQYLAWRQRNYARTKNAKWRNPGREENLKPYKREMKGE